MTDVDSFVPNGLLGNPLDAPEEGLGKGLTVANGSIFVTNGLLSDAGSNLLDNGIDADDDSQEQSREQD